jgi:hypothetical protein
VHDARLKAFTAERAQIAGGIPAIKFEARNPKHETNANHQNSNHENKWDCSLLLSSSFGLGICFGFRASNIVLYVL